MRQPSDQVAKLRRLIKLAQELLNQAEAATIKPANGQSSGNSKRRRRSGKELVSFRKMLKAERKRGVPVAKLAEEHGVSTAYIYQIG